MFIQCDTYQRHFEELKRFNLEEGETLRCWREYSTPLLLQSSLSSLEQKFAEWRAKVGNEEAK